MTDDDDLPRVNRRSALAAIGTGAGTVVGIDALSERAIAWDRFDVCFRGCDEVWMIVTESDIDAGGVDDPPAVAHVIVASGGEAVCRPVEFTAENATTLPERFGDSPVVTYDVDGDEKILGVLEYNYTPDRDERFDEPVWCVNANQNDCATMAGTPDLLSAPCLPNDHPECPNEEFCGSDGGTGDGDIQTTWEDCETVRMTGDDEGLEEIIVHPIRCFPGDGPCPDGVPGGRTIEDPELPLTIDDRYLAVDGDDVPYYIRVIELEGDIEQDAIEMPDDLDCSFESDTIDVTFEDCETLTLSGPDEKLEKIELYIMRCFEDSGLGCPDGHLVTREDPELPLTLGRDDLAVEDEEYRIDAVDLFGDVQPDDATPPEDLDCSFDDPNDETGIEFRMDDRSITLAEDDDPVSTVTITGHAKFSYAGWEDDGPVDHAFITSWARSDAEIDFPDRDIQRYHDVDGDSGTVSKDIEITVDVPPEVGDPTPGESIETEITGHLFYGLEQDSDDQPSLGDWREQDPMALTVEREESDGGGTNEIEVTWEDCETVSVTGNDENLEGIDVLYSLCFEDPGPCPDGTLRSVEDPELPLTIEDQYLTVDDVAYRIDVVELSGDVEPGAVQRPEELDCSF
jgi:hypothetical protein